MPSEPLEQVTALSQCAKKNDWVFSSAFLCTSMLTTATQLKAPSYTHLTPAQLLNLEFCIVQHLIHRSTAISSGQRSSGLNHGAS